MSFEHTGAFGAPGIQAALETIENVFWWGRWESHLYVGAVVEGDSRDTGNTGYTEILRPGLIMGKKTTGDKWMPWNGSPGAGDEGIDTALGVLSYSQKMTRRGADQDRWFGWIMLGGGVKARNLLVPGSTSFGLAGSAHEHIIRAQMHPRFTFDANPAGNRMGGWKRIKEVASLAATAGSGAITVTEADSGTLWLVKGSDQAITFTTPATAEKGLWYGFYNAVDQNLTVTAGTADTMVTLNDIAADSVSFSTSSEKIGGMFELFGDGALWLVAPRLADGAQTIVPAT